MPPPPPVPDDQRSAPEAWRKFFAIVGVVTAFFFLFTIPGWFALSAYRKWRSGESGQPNVLIGWGVLSSLSLGALTLAIAVVTVMGPNAPKTDAYGYTEAEKQYIVSGLNLPPSTKVCVLAAFERGVSHDEYLRNEEIAATTGGYSATFERKLTSIFRSSGCY